MLLSIADARPRNLESVRAQSLLPSNIQSGAANLIAFIQKYYEYINTSGLPSREIGSIISDKDIDSQSNLYLDNIRELIALNIPNSTVLDKVSLYKIIINYYNTRGSEESILAFFRIFLNQIVSVSYPREQLFAPSSGKFVRTFSASGQPLQLSVTPTVAASAPVNGSTALVNGNRYVIVQSGNTRSVYFCTVVNTLTYALVEQYEYKDVHGMPSNTDKIQDSYYWQAYSYVIKTDTDAVFWLDPYLKFVHPAGLKLFVELVLQLFSANDWDTVIENYFALSDAADSNSWLKSLIWDKSINHQHSPKYQPGWNRSKILFFLLVVDSNLENNSNTAKTFFRGAQLYFQLYIQENINGAPQSVGILNASNYDSALKFIDAGCVDNFILNSTIEAMSQPNYSLTQYGIRHNLGAYVTLAAYFPD